MNKTTEKELGLYHDYWTEMGLIAKKEIKSMKIKVNGHWRNPKASDFKMQVGEPHNHGLTKEEKKQRFEDAPYSDYHYKLIALSYGKPSNELKKQALKAAHEQKIQHIIFNKNLTRFTRYKHTHKNCPHIVILKRIDSKGNPYEFSTTPTRKSLHALFDECYTMARVLNKHMDDFHSVEIWEKSEISKKMKNEPAKARYIIDTSTLKTVGKKDSNLTL